ncbi:right-handed parallel beta-helix repeat-containing protein [Vibrio ponticus]|uniref:Right-handed parallel beta-helix repeat-containing protein n=1 Tax=Vibrio ponticus TaxID=265668 RepID=A0A3N3DY00_9VIBR|nr:DUF6701 domain-containing protein [Vibrio ponticus]ROV59269.1 right-handed parallel beta-helix repeat-containing protein [Vibrio ponticus]
MKNSWLVLIFTLLLSSFAFADDDDGDVRGFVFEHYDYGGVSRNYNPIYGMSAMSRKSIKVRLTRTTYPHYVYVTYTGHDGYFDFDDIPNGTYRLDLPGHGTGLQDLDGDLYSERGDCNPCLPVRVYPTVSEDYGRDVVVNGRDVDASIGFSYSVVSNHHDSGVGSLRQFLINTAYLTSGRNGTNLRKENLRQSGRTPGVDNAIFKNQINEIILQSPLQMNGVSRTYVDAGKPGDESPLFIRNGRTNPENQDYGLRIKKSQYIRIAGINWRYFDDAINLSDSNHIEIEANRFNDMRGSGLRFYNSNDNIIHRNIFDDTVNKEDTLDEAAALYLNSSWRNEVTNNAFYNSGVDHISAGGHEAHVSAIRVYYGAQNRLSRNIFRNTRGLAIDLRSVDHAGMITPNDGQYMLSGGISNYGIDFPELTEVSSDGQVRGSVYLSNLASYTDCHQSYEDFTVEVYKADGNASDSTIEGTEFLGTCGLDGTGEISNCNLNSAGFSSGDAITSIAIDKCGNTSEMGQTVIVSGGNYDFGDAPNQDLATGWEYTSYPVTAKSNGARHTIVADTCLLPSDGTSCLFHVDAERDGIPSRTASSDQEDDGITVNSSNSSTMKVLLTDYLDQNGNEQVVDNTITVNASRPGFVSIWLDKNQDGSWDGFERNQRWVSEKIVDRVAVQAGQNRLSDFHLSPYDVHGETFMRVRYATKQDDVEQPTGIARDGEVEDYQVWIAAPSIEVAGCEAGLQNGSFEHFFIEREHNGWDTPESSVAGWSVQQLDPTADPQNYPISRRNHIEFNDYNQYVSSKASDNSQNVAEMNAYHPTVMYQDIVTTPGEKIRWSFDYSNRTVGAPSGEQQIALLFGSPNTDLVESQTFTGTDQWQNYTGLYTVPDGQYVTRIAFKSLKPIGGSSGNILDNAKFGCEVGKDYGDLPSRYRNELKVGYRVVPNLYIGDEAPDVEKEAHSSEYASGDDQNGFNDELTFSAPIVLKRVNSVVLPEFNVLNNTGKVAHLNAWIDFNRDGVMSNNEKSTLSIKSFPYPQAVELNWQGNHKWTNESSTYLRLTLSHNSNKIEDGEVEDHLVYLVDGDLMPEPGRCDGFVQVKAPDRNGAYQYAKWVASGGELQIEPINSSLATDEIKVVGLSQADGFTYGVGSDSQYGCTQGSRSSCEIHLFVADQSKNAQFQHLTALRAAHDDVVIQDRNGKTYTFAKNEILDTKKSPDSGKGALSRANSGDVSPDGRYMVIGRGNWHSLVRIELATGLFDTIQLKDIQGSTPWSADFAFNPKDQNGDYVYGLSGDLKSLYRIAIRDVSSAEPAGSNTQLRLKLVLNSNSSVSNPEWPQRDSNDKLGSGGLAINKGGIMFAMTNGGRHDLNQDGKLSSYEKNHPTTALYSVDIAKQEIRFELKGVDESTSSNDAGGCSIHADYGDVPEFLENNDPAHHLGSNEELKLGHNWSADIGPGHDLEAASDLSDDGVTLKDRASNSSVNLVNDPLIPGRAYRIELDKRGSGVASAWVNWGIGTSWKRVDLSQALVVPSSPTAHGSRGYLRVRYAAQLVDSPYGEAGSGEVEDHSFVIGNPVKGVQVNAPGSPLTCEVAEYLVTLDVDGDQLSEDINVDVAFDNPPAGCWFSATPFSRINASSQTRCNDGQTISFAKGSELSRTLWVATDSELKDVTLTATAKDIGSASDGARFTKEGFTIEPVNAPLYYKAGEEFNIQLVRKVALEDQVQCSVDTDYQGEKTFTFAFNKGTEKVLGDLALKGQALQASGEDRKISFSNGVSEVLAANYSESGMFELMARYLPVEGLEKSATFSTTFVPYALIVSQNYKASDSSVVSGNSSAPFVSAGTPFMVEVSAVNKQQQVTRNFDGQLSAENKGYSAQVTVPSSKVSETPKLTMPNGLEREFSQGKLLNRFEYDNVGSIATNWAVDSYRDQTGLNSFLDTSKVSDFADFANHVEVGYFYPDHFAMTRLYQVPMNHSGEAWTYFGKPDVDVSFVLDAKSANNRSLSFYDSSVLASGEQPSLAGITFDYGSVGLPSCSQALLVDENMNADVFSGEWDGGQWQLEGRPNQFYRDQGCKQELANIQLFAHVEDNIESRDIPIYQQGDSSENLASTAIALGEPIDVRYGRLVIENASGPINQLFPMAIETQYWDGSRFKLNDWDGWTQIGASNEAQLPELDDVVTEAAVVGEAQPVLMSDSLQPTALSNGKSAVNIGANAPGHAVVPMTLSSGAEKWLGYCWEVDSNSATTIPSECNAPSSFWQPPKALATFGVSGGSNNVIYIKERYN